ncbi:MAG TPA: hypothetical protein VGX37_08485 [Allosphingosinicella sp.]|nr:hypothetical protein [Allosphingosinicella sp.]
MARLLRCTRVPDTRTFLLRALALIAVTAATGACDWMHKKDPAGEKGPNEVRREREAQLRRACASELTYDRLKEYAFDEAQRIRGRDERLLDDIATASVVRMEQPVVKSRDEALNVTVCTGRFVLELPPGTENAFDGERRLAAEVEYAAQAAVDGSGLVYQMSGAEPIIYRLATIGGLPPAVPLRQVATAEPVPPPSAPAVPVQPVQPVQRQAQPQPQPRPQRQPPPQPQPKRDATAAAGQARPSYNCRQAGTRTERMVCASPDLASRDRRMASVYYAEMARADGSTRQQLRRSRDRFLARRERCSTESCVAAAYEERVREIRQLTGGQ